MTQYMVTGACAPATTQSPGGGRVRQLFFKGQPLPPDTPQTEIQHLLSVNLISAVAGQAATEPPVQAPVATTVTGEPDNGQEPDGGQGSEPAPGAEPPDGEGADTGADPEVEQKRAEARAKLPADGSKPDGRAGQAVWVEWLVGKGYDYGAVAKADKKELVELAGSLDQ